MFVPRLEVEHAAGATGIERIAHYDEYPGDPRAETALADLLAEMGSPARSAPTRTATHGSSAIRDHRFRS